MKKILFGLSAAIAIAVAGFFGFDLYMQHRVKSEVEAAFEQIRATGAKASHGKVSFDLRSRTVTIADIAAKPASGTPFSVKIASVTAAGVSQSDPARFSADSIDVADVEVSVTTPTRTISRVTYKAPRITVKAYSGPTAIRRLPASPSVVELYRFGFEQLASITAASITAPNVTGTMTFDVAAQGGAGDGEFTYDGAAMEGLKDGKIASMKADGFRFRFNQPAGLTKQMIGDLANFVASDVDAGAAAALFDPGKANDDQDHRIYGRISTGPYVITSPQGLNLRIDGMIVDDIGLKPSRVQFQTVMAMIPPAGAAPPTPAQVRVMMEGVASLYEGIRIGNAELHGLSVGTPQGPLKLQAIRFNFANGKIGEIALEGLDGREPRGPVKVGRFALKSLDVANLTRMIAQFAAQKPSVEQALALFPLIEGAEIKALTVPYKSMEKPLDVDILSLDWGQFVGPIPSKVHLIAKMSGPLDATDLGQQELIAAGIDTMKIDADLGAAWTEASRSFALEPAKLEVGGLLNAAARLSLANVTREVFSVSPAQAMGAAAQIETGPIELAVHDLGVVDLVVAQYARAQDVSREVARQAIVQSIREASTAEALEPAGDALKAALVSFVETPGQTLVIKLTPLAKVPALQLIQLLQSEPLLALTQFRIEASAGF